MAVTNFSPLLGLALPTTGDLSGTWGTTVNDAITSLLDSAVAGTTTLSVDTDVTLSTTNGAANQARNAIILWTASNGATTRYITAPAQSKAYTVLNAGTGSIVLRGAGPTTGVTIVSGETCVVAWAGTDFAKVATSVADGVTTISFGSTGLTPSVSTSGAVTVSGTLAVANGGTGVTTSTGSGANVLSTSPTLVTPALGTPSSGTLTNATGLPIDGGTTGTLPVVRGGTGTATPALVQGANITITGTWPNQTIAAAAPGTGTVTSVSGAGTVNGISLSGTVTSSGSLTLGGALTGVDLATQVTGTLPVANGGTGATSLTANNVILGNGTSAVQVVAPGTTGNVLTSNGTTWQSSTPAAQVYPGAGVAVSTGTAWDTSLTAPSGALVGTTDTQTLTNKRVTPRSVDIASAATITPTGDTADQYEVTALATAATIAAPSGTPTDGQKLVLRIKDNGTARALTWTTTSGAYRAVGVTLPTTTVLSKVVYIGCVYNAQDTFWDVLAVAQLA